MVNLMKNNIIIKSILRKKTPYVILMILSPLIVVLGTITKKTDLFNEIFNSLDWYWFYIIYMLSIFSIYMVSFNTLTNDNIKQRFQNIKELYIQITKYSFILSIIYTIILFILITLLSTIIIKNVELINYNNYQVKNIIYYIFYIIKILLISNFVSLIGVLLQYLYNKNISILFVVTINMSSFIYPIEPTNVKSILDMNFHPFKYFQISNYSSFIFEVLILLLYLSILNIIVSIMLKKGLEKNEYE